MDARIDLLAMDRDVLRCRNTYTDLVSFDTEHRNLDIIANPYGFAAPSCQYEHLISARYVVAMAAQGRQSPQCSQYTYVIVCFYNQVCIFVKNYNRTKETKSRLVRTAVRLLVERDYHRLTFVEIANRSGLSRGAIHHHFKSMPELMLAVISYIEQEITASVVKDFDGITLDREALQLSVDLIWEQLQTDKFRAFMRLRAALETDDELAALVKPALVDATERWNALVGRFVTTKDASFDAQLSRIVLTALSGAAMTNATVGPPASDPQRREFLKSLKRVIASAR